MGGGNRGLQIARVPQIGHKGERWPILKVSWSIFFEAQHESKAADVLLAELRERKFNYAGEVISVRRDLEAALVFPAWPAAADTARLPLERVLPPAVWKEVACPEASLKPPEDWPAVPHRSRVYACQTEWDKIAFEGLRRGLFHEVSLENVFVGSNGTKVFNGAMGVDKWKEGTRLLRFISILTPLNQHLREVRGEVDFLPYIAHALLVDLGPDDEAVVDSEDFVSCFNLLQMPDAWAGHLAYAMPTSRARAREQLGSWQVARGSEMAEQQQGDTLYVAIRTVPMGWSAAVGVVQAVVRQLVFGRAGVSLETEVAKCKRFPPGPNYSLVYLDSFDFIRVRSRALIADLESTASEEHARFEAVCRELGLPLNMGKSLVGAYHATLQGGEFDGHRGLFGHARERSSKFAAASLVISLADRWEEPVLRHWAGLATFAFCYRRPLMSILYKVFQAAGADGEAVKFDAEVWDEMLLAGILVPLAISNLRTGFRAKVSIADASETGAGAAESAGPSPAVLNQKVVGQFVGSPGLAAKLAGLRSDGFETFPSMQKYVQGGPGVLARGGWLHAHLEDSPWGAASGRSRRHRRGKRTAATERADAELRLGVDVFEQRAMLDGFSVLEVPDVTAIAYTPRLRSMVREREVVRVVYSGRAYYLSGGSAAEREALAALLEMVLASPRPEAAYIEMVRLALRAVAVKRPPEELVPRAQWLQRELQTFSKILANNNLVPEAVRIVAELAETAKKADVVEHVRSMVRLADHRGSDVRLVDGHLDRASRQAFPYPTWMWAWKIVAAYPWQVPGHINVLELQAVCDYCRRGVQCGTLHGKRFLHVVDSMVTACVVAKGRSSSRVLNRALRRLAAHLLAGDAYPFLVWTLSGWNCADRPSRWTARPYELPGT